MNARDLIYELIQGDMDDEVRIYDAVTDELYETNDIEVYKGCLDLIIRSNENE